MAAEHGRPARRPARQRPAAGGPEDGAEPTWFKYLDVAIWIMVIVAAGLAIEWLVGRQARESVAKGAERFLAKITPSSSEPAD